MFDIHLHILPEDHKLEWITDAVKAVREAADNGVKNIILTPNINVGEELKKTL